MHSDNSSCFLVSSECERILFPPVQEQRICSSWNKFFPLNGINSYRRVFLLEANRKSDKLYAYVKMEDNMEMSSLILNIFIELACSGQDIVVTASV